MAKIQYDESIPDYAQYDGGDMPWLCWNTKRQDIMERLVVVQSLEYKYPI